MTFGKTSNETKIINSAVRNYSATNKSLMCPSSQSVGVWISSAIMAYKPSSSITPSTPRFIDLFIWSFFFPLTCFYRTCIRRWMFRCLIKGFVTRGGLKFAPFFCYSAILRTIYCSEVYMKWKSYIWYTYNKYTFRLLIFFIL